MEYIRDPVHKIITYSKLEKKVIDTALVQRLKWISQLSTANQVFPGGTNNRFSHSLGVMQVAGKYMAHLRDTCKVYNIVNISEKQIQIARMAGLLHDMGHGPFSHTFDRAVYSKIYGIPDGGHDQHRLRLVYEDELSNALYILGITPQDLISVWTAKPDDGINFIIKLVIGGSMGADRMDFVLRDSHFTGATNFGIIAMERIILSSLLCMDKKGIPRLTFKMKAIHDIVQALEGRKYMYHGIYLHKTAVAAGLLLEEMMDACTIDLKLIDRVVDFEKFKLLNDTLIGEIMALLPKTHRARQMCQRLLKRKLPKLVSEKLVTNDNDVVNETDNFENKEYQDDENMKTVKTRFITGIDPFKFDEQHTYFVEKKKYGKLLTCNEALLKINHTTSKPYYLLRVYSF